MNQMEVLKEYIEQLQNEAFERGFKIASEQGKRHGHWIDHSDEGYVECPYCRSATNCEDNIDELHYCFYCGAKMDEVNHESDKEQQISECEGNLT